MVRSRAGWILAVGLAALALPGSAAQEPLPRLPGDGPAVEQGTTLHAREANSRIVLWMLGHDGSESFVATGGAPLTGVASAPNRAAIFTALSTGRGATIVRTGAGAAKETLSIDEPGISSRAFAEALAKAAGAKGVAISRDAERGELGASLKNVPVDAAIAAYSTATGTRVVIGRDLLFVLPKDRALVDLPSKKPDPAFSLRITGATASQTVALLEAAGIALDGRVPCAVGGAVWLDASEVRADEAMRAIRLVAGAGDEIGNAETCAPKAWRDGKTPSLAGAAPLGVVRTKKRSAVLVQSGTDVWLVTSEAIGKGGRLLSGNAVVLGPIKPGKPSLDTTLAAWPAPAGLIVTDELDTASLAKSTLRATVVGPRRKSALLDAADGSVVVLRSPERFEIGDGTLAEVRAGSERVLLTTGGLAAVDSERPKLALQDHAEAPKDAPKNEALRNTTPKNTTPNPKKPPEPVPPDTSAGTSVGTSTRQHDAGAVPSTGGETGGGSPRTPAIDSFGDGDASDAPMGGTPAKSSTFGEANTQTAPAPGLPSGVETDSLKPPERSGGSKRSFALAGAENPLWAVEPFAEKAGWLGTHTALAARYRGDSWGDTFALALEAALRERGRRAQAVESALTDDQIRTLIRKEALKFVIAGEVRALGVANGKIATLVVAVKVRKESAGSMKVVDVRTHPGSLTIAGTAVTEAELVALYRVTAARAADAVVESLPHDLFAVRN